MDFREYKPVATTKAKYLDSIMSILTGFVSTLLVILWPPYVGMGALAFSILHQWPGFLVFVSANCGLAIYLNKARKARQNTGKSLFDDRLFKEAKKTRDL